MSANSFACPNCAAILGRYRPTTARGVQVVPARGVLVSEADGTDKETGEKVVVIAFRCNTCCAWWSVPNARLRVFVDAA